MVTFPILISSRKKPIDSDKIVFVIENFFAYK